MDREAWRAVVCGVAKSWTWLSHWTGRSESKASACNAGDQGSIPGSGRSPGEGNGNPLQYSCLEKSQGQRSLVGYSPWGCKQSDTTEWLHKPFWIFFFFLYDEGVCSNFTDLHVAVQLSQYHLLKRLSFSHCIFLDSLFKINWPWVCGFISGLSILFHWSICLFLCQYHAVLITVAL